MIARIVVLLFIAISSIAWSFDGGWDGGDFPATKLKTSTDNFDGILSPSDITVQLALDTIDDLVIPEPDLSLYVPYTGATGSLNLDGNDLLVVDLLVDTISPNKQSLVTIDGNVVADNLSGTNTGDQDLSGYVLKSGPRTIKITADLSGIWSRGITVWEIPFTDLGYGVTLTSITVRSSSADPTTELNANIMKCDAVTTGAFPGANATLVKAIDTTTGNFSWSGTEVIATSKLLYLLLDADPVDIGNSWTIIITYTVATS